jgi:hypothetical protein
VIFCAEAGGELSGDSTARLTRWASGCAKAAQERRR